MVSPLMSMTRLGENRRHNSKYTPLGTTFISPTESLSPIDARMTPIRKSLFQKRRVTSHKRRKESFTPRIYDDSRDDLNEIESLRSANKKKDGHLKILHDRFSHIQKGLGSIDDERNQLVERAKRLDIEKKVILKQLELREREILTIIKRCASQEEKIRESSKLRSTNKNLKNNLELMEKKLKVIEMEMQDGQSLKKLLQESELEREQLKDRLAKLQRDYDAIADTLQECLGNIRQLTEEKHAIEEERRRERKRAEIELENQHLAHMNDSNGLKENIQEHQKRILQMEGIIHDKIKSNTDLRREKAVISQEQQEEIQIVVEKYEQQLNELRNEIEETTIEKKRGSQIASQEFLSSVKNKLKSKDDLITELETEFSDQMMELISKQSSLDEAEEERRNLKLKVEASQKLEIEHAALLDFVEIMDSNLVELTTANAHLELEKDELREEADELQKKANILQKQFSSLQNNHKAKEIDFRDLLNTEKEELQTELQESLRKAKSEIVSLQAELENREQRISKLEIDRNDARKLIADKEDEISRVINKMEELRSNLGADLRRARHQAAHFEAEVFAKNQTLASLEGRLEGAKVIREAGKSLETDVVSNIINEKAATIPLENEIESLREQLKSKEIDSKKIRTELEKIIQDVRNEAMFLQQKIESLSEEKSRIEDEVEVSRSLINGRDEQIIEVQNMILKHKKRAHELERRLQYTTKELEDHKEKLSTIEQESSNRNPQSQDLTNTYSDSGILDIGKAPTKKPTNNYSELEERIRMLENELLEVEHSRSRATAKLDEARKTIEKLERQFIEKDARNVSLQNQLQDATKDLREEESKAYIMENEYHTTTQLQTVRENYEEEARSKVTMLEEKIEEMKKQSIDLDIQIKESRKENNEKGEMISSLKFDLVEDREETKELRSELNDKCTEIKNLEDLLSRKDNSLKSKIETTNSSLRSKEDRIVELEKLVASNEENVKSLQESLSKAKNDMVQFEDRIRHDEDERIKLEEQLRDVHATTNTTRSFDDHFLPSSDTNDLKQKIQYLLTRKCDLATELDKTKAILKEERESWTVKANNSYKELAIQKAQLLVLQNVLIERERMISMLQKDEKEDENRNILAESNSSDYENTISDLKSEIKLKEKKINDLEQQIVNKKQDGIHYAFVESDTRRIALEDELAAAQKNIGALTSSANAREQRVNEVEKSLKKAHKDDFEKENCILSAERQFKLFEEKAQSLEDKLRVEKAQISKLNSDIKSMRIEIKEKGEVIRNFNASTLSLKQVAEKASNEIARKSDILISLKETSGNLQLELEKAKNDITARDDKIKYFEDSLNIEKQSRVVLEEEIEAMRKYVSKSQKIKEDLKKELDQEKLGNKAAEELLESRKAFEALKHSNNEHVSKLEIHISKIKGDLTLKDIEIRDLRLVELMTAKETSISLTKEVDSWKAEALKKNKDHALEKESFILQIDKLQSELQTLSLKNKNQDDQHDRETDSLRKTKQELESTISKLTDRTNRRDATIEELKVAFRQDAQGEAEIRRQRDALQVAESEARDQLEYMRVEFEGAAAREQELTETRLENKDSLHREEIENVLFELESNLEKLQDSEELLAERSCRLGEMVDHNGDIELELEKEQEERRKIEDKFVQEKNDLDIARIELKKVQAELRRKESVLESKLKEERNQKEYAEESLRITKAKYKEAIKAKRNVTELERENGELKDKILRQEAYLKRKLEKQKTDRSRLTPSKSIASHSKSALKTPAKRTISSSRKELPPSSTYSRSRLRAPSTISRGISTGVPSIHKSRSNISPTAASCRSARTAKSVFSRSTEFDTPSKQISTLSAQDILQSEIDDDRSVDSEVSSILYSPKGNSFVDTEVQDWELEPREL